MYFFYLILGCLSIRSSTSYVLLAANIEDFRSLAKRFAPESIADQIIALAGGQPEQPKDDNSDESHVSEQTSEEGTPVNQRHVKRGSDIKNPKRASSKYEVQLEDLVSRVKERLQKELTLMATSKFTPGPDDVEATPEATQSKEIGENPRINKPSQSRYIKRPHGIRQPQQSGEDSNKERNVGQERYVENMKRNPSFQQAAMQPSSYLDQKKRVPSRQVPASQQRLRKPTTARDSSESERKIVAGKTSGAATEDIFNLFQGIDMFSKKDSYEDYVTPKKDYNYDEQVSARHPTEKTNIRLFTDEVPVYPNAGNKDVDSRDDNDETINYNHKRVTPSNEGRYNEGRTTRHNKLRTVERPQKPIGNLKRLPKMKRPIIPQHVEPLQETAATNDRPLPYAEQLAESGEYVDETPIIPIDEVKARTESILAEDVAVRQPIIQPPDMTNPNLMNRHKNKKVQKAGTVIPKRDFYKMSSPNYVAKLPKVAESYKFDEPIPEKDREPEQLDPIGNPPSSINGKVRLS